MQVHVKYFLNRSEVNDAIIEYIRKKTGKIGGEVVEFISGGEIIDPFVNVTISKEFISNENT